MAAHLGIERRRYPRVTLLPASGSTTTLIPVSQAEEQPRQALARAAVLDSHADTIGLPGASLLRTAAVAGLSLAVCGGATFVAVRLVMVGAAWAAGRSGDAVTT